MTTKLVPRDISSISRLDYENLYGGRDRLLDLMEESTAITPAVSKVLTALANPDYATMKMRTLLSRCGCSLAEWTMALRDATVQHAHSEAMRRMMQRLPEVAEDIMDAAITKERACDCTKGPMGTIPASIACELCLGRGWVVQRPTTERHKLAAEVTGLLKKSPTIVNQNVQQTAFGVGSFDKLIKQTDAAMEQQLRPDVIEAHVEEVPHE